MRGAEDTQLSAQFFVRNLNARMHEQDRGMRIGDDFLDDAVAAVPIGIRKTIQERPFLWVLDEVVEITPFFVAKRLAIGDEKLNVARVGLIDVGVIDLVDDTVRNREPEAAARVISRSDSFLRAPRPARLQARRSEGDIRRFEFLWFCDDLVWHHHRVRDF